MNSQESTVKNEIEVVGPGTDVAPAQALTPMAMLDRAVASGASIEVLERLMES